MAKKISIVKVKSYFKYMLSGVPAFLIAVLLNWILVEHIKLPVLLAYLLVLAVQVNINYLICHYVVFNKKERPNLRGIGQFSIFVLVFQGLTWLAYAVMVKWVGIYYLLAQLINIAFFSVFKFIWASKIFR